VSLAPGIGKRTARVAISEAPALVRCRVQRLATGARDGDGYELHFVYTATRRLANDATSSEGSRKAEIHFDPQGRMILPHCGALELTGGAGEWVWEIEEPIVYGGQADWPAKRLTKFCRIGSSFAVPDHHTAIGALNATVSGSLPTGDPILLSPTPTPIVSGTVISTLSASVTIFTLWDG